MLQSQENQSVAVLVKHRLGEIENNNEEPDLKAISTPNRRSIAYFRVTLLQPP